MRRHRAYAVAIALAAMAWNGSPAPTWAKPLQLRIGWATAPTHVQPLIDELAKRHPEIFRHYGTSYVAEGVHFRGSTPQIQALATGDLQIAAFAPSALALAINNAHLDLRVVADVFQDAVPGYASITYAVEADSPIRKVEDLKGHTVATNAIGSFGDSAMRTMFRKHGLDDNDVTSVETNFGNMPAMLDSGKVDMINLLPQYMHFLAEGKYRILFTSREAQGLSEAQIWAIPAGFLAAHRAVLVDFFEDHIGALNWLIDPAHHDEAVKIAEDVTKQPLASLSYVFTRRDVFRAPDAMANIPEAQKLIDNDVQLGVLKKGLKIAPKYVDLSLVEAANRRLKRE